MKNLRIVCAAIRNPQGRIVCGARHWDDVMREQVCNRGLRRLLFGRRPRKWYSAEQGFVDQFGTFHSREAAWVIALAAGQIRMTHPSTSGSLFSEDLY